jgi:hypothetical protein
LEERIELKPNVQLLKVKHFHVESI